MDRLIRMRLFWLYAVRMPACTVNKNVHTSMVGAVGSNSGIAILLPYLPAETRPSASASVTPWSQVANGESADQLGLHWQSPIYRHARTPQKGTIFRPCRLQLVVTACTAVIERCTLL